MRQLTKETPDNGSISSGYENKMYPFEPLNDGNDKNVEGKAKLTFEVTLDENCENVAPQLNSHY
jgi:hypothetical protein